MARDKVELLVEIIGKDGVTKLLDSAATEALKMERNLKRSSKAADKVHESVDQLRQGWAGVLTGLNQGLELFGKVLEAANAVKETVQETARIRQVEQRFTQKLNVSVQELAEASGFQLTDIGLKQFALQAQQAGVSMKDFKGLLDFALKASAASGREFEEVFEGVFVDTVVGASDSFLEQIGIVADMGTITEAYAKKHHIAKDAIDKTHQSQAMLNYILTEGRKKFEDVNIDQFVTDLARAEKEIERVTDTGSKMFTLFAKDVLQTFGVVGRDVPNNIQNLKDQMQKLDNLFAKIRSGKFGDLRLDEYGTLSEARALEVEALTQQIGRTARQSDLAMKMLFDRLQEQAREMSNLAGGWTSAADKAEMYDKALLHLAKQYGVLDVAESTYTTNSKERLSRWKYYSVEVANLSNAYSGLAFNIGQAKTAQDEFDKLKIAGEGKVQTPSEVEFGLSKIDTKEQEKREKQERRRKYQQYLARARAAKRARDQAIRQAKKDTVDLYNELAKQQSNINAVRAQDRENARKDTEDFYKSIAMESEEDNRRQALYAADRQEALAKLLAPLHEIIEKNTIAGGFSTLSDGILMLGEAANASSERMERLGRTAEGIKNTGVQLQALTKTGIEFAKVNEKGATHYVALGDAIAGAGLSAAAGFIEGERERAGVLAAMEYAHAGAALAQGILTGAPNAYVASAIHLANAGMYTAIAAGAGKAGPSGGGAAGAAGASGGGARRIPQFNQPQPAQGMQPAQVVVNMSGAIVAGANRKKTANDLGDLVQESMAGRR